MEKSEDSVTERTSRWSLPCLICLGLLVASVGRSEDTAGSADAKHEFFEKQVRPILVARCFECHAGGDKTPKGGLRVDSRDALLTGGDTGPAVTLDQPSTSLLLSAINYGDLYQMPPKSKLPANEIAVLSKWVETGLTWPKESSSSAATVKPFDLTARATEHWCWQPLQPSPPPVVKDAAWPVSTVDRFILEKLEAKAIHPAPPADKRALLRRIYFDLVGLPPTPDEVEKFVQDQRPRAFEDVVDRLLGSVHFGERWGRHWLDLTRYAETRGHEFEPIIPNAWQYRDYVIRALNTDVPYDRFLTEQIAGDLIEPRWRFPAASPAAASESNLSINESLLGTGFWFLGEEVHSPVDIRKDETDRIDNRLDVLSKTFLGLTVACARCHDHKFDAISQQDYYALAGFAISSSYRQIRVETVEQHRRIAGQLADVRRQAERALANALIKTSQPVIDKLDRYWLSALQAVNETTPRSPTGAAEQAAATTTVVARLATETGLDATLLERWYVEMNLAKADKQHPLHGLIDGTTNDQAARAGRDTPAAPPGLVVDFGAPATFPPLQDGVSFGLQPVPQGQLIISGTPAAPKAHVATIGGWERDLFWKKNTLTPGTEVDASAIGAGQPYGRMVRSPEFHLAHRRAWYLVRGSVRAYAVVNSHLIVVGPLHNSLVREFKQADDQWHWVSHDLDLYQGHRLHVEFSPIGDESCSIALVVQSDEQPQWPDALWRGMHDAVASAETQAARVVAYQKAFRDAAQSLVVDEANHSPNRDRAELADWFVKHSSLFSLAEITQPMARLHEAEAELAKQVRWESTLAPAIFDGNGVDESLLVRGNSNTPKAPVPRRFLAAFNSSSPESAAGSSANIGSGRLQLARDILRSPLASRVAVNRIWHHLFGRGIVPTVDNLGVLGLPPSHPALLDHLAQQFMQESWSTKAMIRALVLSRTYQMSSRPTTAESVDPNNELWHRMPLKRLEGEVIRDSLLAVSGRLDRTPFGPSVPIHLTEFMQGRGRPGASGPLDGNGRRSIYISVRRNFLSPMMLAFDTPNPFSTVGRRTVSNVPAQALILMNDPFVIEQANRWADLLLSDSAMTTEQRINRMYLTAFARPNTPDELVEATTFLNSQDAGKPEHQREAWSQLCHVIFNVKEFIFVE